jgi:hypothetical protein
MNRRVGVGHETRRCVWDTGAGQSVCVLVVLQAGWSGGRQELMVAGGSFLLLCCCYFYSFFNDA